MQERTGLVTVEGNPLTLLGGELNEGDDAPDVELLDGSLTPVSLSSMKGKVVVLVAVPSLDTRVCDVEARRFNEEAEKLGETVAARLAKICGD